MEDEMDELPEVPEVREITGELLIELLLKNDSYHGLHEDIAHELGQITKTDEAHHTQNLYRAGLMRPDNQGRSKMKYQPHTFRASRIEDEFAEFRQPKEKVVVK